MELKEFWPTIGIPVVGFILGTYHKLLVSPRLKDVESKTDHFIADIAEVKTDIKWIRATLDKKYNGNK